MSMQNVVLAVLFCLSSGSLLAQKDTAEKPNKVSMICLNFTAENPFASMANRYGTNVRIGSSFLRKNEKNSLWGIKLDFISGNSIKEDSFLSNLLTHEGQMIDLHGNLYTPKFFERGYIAGVEFGKELNFWKANKNSGPMVLTGVGFMQHKIKIFDRDNLFPQFKNEYYKGYDRLTNGLYIEQYVGYLYFGTRKAITLHGGLNVLCGFTQGRRAYLFDRNIPGNDKRIDVLAGARMGMIIPIFKRHTEEIYY